MPNQELLNQYPNLQHFFPYIEQLNKESDRGKVLISSGFLEEQLKQILMAFMIEGAAAVNLVDGPNAPFGTFSSRIAASYALALISEVEHHDLSLIRKIRNNFAHSMYTTFDTPEVASRCAVLKMRIADFEHPDVGPVVVGQRERFTTAAVSLIMNFSNRAHYVSLGRRAFSRYPY